MIGHAINLETVGKRLVKLRSTKSQSEVANAVNVTLSAIKNYEAGLRMPRDEIKIRLAKYFGTSVDSIFFDEDVTNSDVCDTSNKMQPSPRRKVIRSSGRRSD